jgi:hypothetical protein
MTTSYKSGDNLGVTTGYNEKDIPENVIVPSCTIEDVDYALFSLFDKELNLSVKDSTTGKHKKPPIVFSSGERWALIKNNKLLRDRSGAIILPIITVQRSSISQRNEDIVGRGINQNSGQLVIYKKLASEDIEYQNLLNNQKIPNQGSAQTERNDGKSYNNLINNDKQNNVFEVITIPSPQFYTIKYTVTIWTQYLQQLNNIIEQMMAAYLPVGSRSFKIVTKKGYWFIAKVEEDFKDETNFTDMSDNERIIKSSFEITVPAYFIAGNDIPGVPNPVRRFISAPKITFNVGDQSTIDISDVEATDQNNIDLGNDPSNQFILKDVDQGFVTTFENVTKNSYSVGYIKNPMTNLDKVQYIKVVSKNSKTGETIYVNDNSMKIKVLK